jgi:hypothetical protein
MGVRSALHHILRFTIDGVRRRTAVHILFCGSRCRYGRSHAGDADERRAIDSIDIDLLWGVPEPQRAR